MQLNASNEGDRGQTAKKGCNQSVWSSVYPNTAGFTLKFGAEVNVKKWEWEHIYQTRQGSSWPTSNSPALHYIIHSATNPLETPTDPLGWFVTPSVLPCPLLHNEFYFSPKKNLKCFDRSPLNAALLLEVHLTAWQNMNLLVGVKRIYLLLSRYAFLLFSLPNYAQFLLQELLFFFSSTSIALSSTSSCSDNWQLTSDTWNRLERGSRSEFFICLPWRATKTMSNMWLVLVPQNKRKYPKWKISKWRSEWTVGSSRPDNESDRVAQKIPVDSNSENWTRKYIACTSYCDVWGMYTIVPR